MEDTPVSPISSTENMLTGKKNDCLFMEFGSTKDRELTMLREKNINKIFLDTRVYIKNGKVETDLHIKPTSN